MAGETYEGLQCYGGPVGPTIMVPENIPHYYAELGSPNGSTLQVITVAADSQGTVPPEPPKEFRAPTYHLQTPINTSQPQAVFGSDGICTTAGWTPGGVWYNVGDRSEHPTPPNPITATGVAMIAQGLALVAKG